jgi:integrase
MSAVDTGTDTKPAKTTVRELLLDMWLDGVHGLAPKTAERYRQLADQQIIPHLGAVQIQKLRKAEIIEWHQKLLTSGGKDGRPLSARTVGHAHRVLRKALAHAIDREILTRNVAAAAKVPAVTAPEIQTLNAAQMADVLKACKGHALYPIVALALGTGARRGEILALPWSNVDLEGGTVKIERSLEETRDDLRFKEPKTRHGRRTITLPASAIEALKEHRKRQLEFRLATGLGRPEPDALVFCTVEGEPLSPDNLSRDWHRFVKARKLPAVMFHSLRHSHASALIAAGLDVLSISRRLGHGSPVITLGVYGHLFENKDDAAARAIEAALGPKQ